MKSAKVALLRYRLYINIYAKPRAFCFASLTFLFYYFVTISNISIDSKEGYGCLEMYRSSLFIIQDNIQTQPQMQQYSKCRNKSYPLFIAYYFLYWTKTLIFFGTYCPDVWVLQYKGSNHKPKILFLLSQKCYN